MRFFIVSAFLLLATVVRADSLSPADSIGLEKVHGEVFILHRVEEKETLYSLSRRYQVPIANIISKNPKAEFGLEIGEILRIPIMKTMPMEDGRVVHVVKPSETLYSISKDFNVGVEEIKKWNNMSMSILDIGQELIIYPQGKKEVADDATVKEEDPLTSTRKTLHTVVTGETLYSISRKYGTPLDKLREWNHLSVNDISIGQELVVKADVADDEEQISKPIVPNEDDKVSAIDMDSVTGGSTPADSNDVTVYTNEVEEPMARENTNFEEVEEDGLAELIDDSGNNRKYLALHRTAKTGTIMRVRNEMNGQEVFVRIIGKLPDTGANRNILIKISKAAYEQLGAIDNRFRVRISFIP